MDELKALAPRSFDKTLIDLLAAIQIGQQPIDMPAPRAIALPAPAPAVPQSVLDTIAQLTAHVKQLEADYQQMAAEADCQQMAAEADYQQMAAALRDHSHDITGVDEIKRQLAELVRVVNGRMAA